MHVIFKNFDNFMAMFTAFLAVSWSTLFLSLLGGPLHSYEAQAIGVAWTSLQTGQARTISQALDIAASLPAEALIPSAHAEEIPIQVVEREPEPLELLGGPDVEIGYY